MAKAAAIADAALKPAGDAEAPAGDAEAPAGHAEAPAGHAADPAVATASAKATAIADATAKPVADTEAALEGGTSLAYLDTQRCFEYYPQPQHPATLIH